MTPEYICKVNAKGEVLEANEGFRPSSEVKMHMRIYQERPDVNAVVHAHPMYATTFAIAGEALMDPIMPEAVIFLRRCARLQNTELLLRWKFRTLFRSFYRIMMQLLLENHGALTYSDTLMNAYHRMESVEFYARLMYQARMLGGPKIIPPNKVEELNEIRRNMNLPGRHPAVK
ncbi:MAG: class II aldolase/adducin family protein [Lachnospiraceae bacterium]